MIQLETQKIQANLPKYKIQNTKFLKDRFHKRILSLINLENKSKKKIQAKGLKENLIAHIQQDLYLVLYYDIR